MSSRYWMIIAAVVSVGILLMGWFLGVSPKLDEKANADTQRASIDAQNVSFQQNIDGLRKESKKLDTFQKELSEMQVALPPGDDLSTFLGQLHELEGVSGVKLESFVASSGAPFIAVDSGTDTEISPLVTSDNLIVITIDLKVTGSRAQVLDFVKALQFGKRLFLVNSLTVLAAADPAQPYTGTLSGFLYVLVDPSAPPPTATPVAPVTPTPSPSATPAK